MNPTNCPRIAPAHPKKGLNKMQEQANATRIPLPLFGFMGSRETQARRFAGDVMFPKFAE
jgi:hypothetical protein